MENQNPPHQGGREKRPEHPYYRTLYGDVDRHLDTAIACAVVYEEIVIPPADAYMPGAEFDRANRRARIPELEISTNWDLFEEARDIVDPLSSDFKEDPSIARILRRVPARAWTQALTDAVVDVLMSRELSLPIICSPGRRALMARLVELGVVLGPNSASPDVAITAQLSDYVTLIGLNFRSRTVESLAKVKWQESVRSYASAFQRVISREGATIESLYETIGVAWLDSETAEHIAGSFSTASRVLNFVGFVPGAGTVASALGIAADGAAALTERRAEAHRWYELGPTIQRIESLQRLEARIQELRR